MILRFVIYFYLVGLYRACFFRPGPSPSLFFSALAEPGPPKKCLEPSRAKKFPIRAHIEPKIPRFEPTSSLIHQMLQKCGFLIPKTIDSKEKVT